MNRVPKYLLTPYCNTTDKAIRRTGYPTTVYRDADKDADKEKRPAPQKTAERGTSPQGKNIKFSENT